MRNLGSLVVVLMCAFVSLDARGQANYVEEFEGIAGPLPGQHGPSDLIDRGWMFRNQSEPFNSGDWRRTTTSFQGQHAINVLWNVGFWNDNQSEASSWAILPVIPGQIAGDVIRFFSNSTADSAFDPTAHLEVRYSPSGGTSTGSGAAAVGDFSDVLLDIPDLEEPWTERVATLPGPGRIALRFHIPPNDAGFPTWSGDFDIDTLSVGPSGPPCNQPPTPLPGQTVTWTLAGSPYTVCELLTVPTGGTIIVEPGVVVNVDPDRQIVVLGTMLIQGTAAQRIVMNGGTLSPPPINVGQLALDGTLEASFVDFRGHLHAEALSTLTLADCSFDVFGPVSTTGRPWIDFARCTFSSTSMSLSGTLGIIEDCTFTNSHTFLDLGYIDLRGTNTFTGHPLEILGLREIQPKVIDGVHVSGVADKGGLVLRVGNFLLGPNNVLQGNLYPITLKGGLDPQSVIPLTGNTINVIDVVNGSTPQFARWPDLGLPYRLTDSFDGPGGLPTVDPGVTVEVADTAGLFSGGFSIMGLPDAPITLHAVAPATEWQGLTWVTADGLHHEYVTVRDAHFGIVASESFMHVSNCVFENNQIGVNVNTFGVLYFDRTRFVNNGTGVELTSLGHANLNGGLNPNSFEGNGIGMDVASSNDARNCWWNDPSGPQVLGNPGGQGDSIVGATTLFEPFLTVPPNFADVPPVVRLVRPGFHKRSISGDDFFDNNEKYIVRWNVIGNGVDHFRIEFSGEGDAPDGFSIVADNLPADQRSYEWTVPTPPFAVTGQFQFLRVTGVDATGKEGFDQAALVVPPGDITGQLTITTDLAGQTFIAGQAIPNIQWTGSLNIFDPPVPLIVLENEGRVISGLTIGGIGEFHEPFPNISTDRARLALRVLNNSNRVKYFFAPGHFSIRHDTRFGFVPPTVEMLTPIAGETFAGGSVVPITWTAAATEGLHSFDVLASYNGGLTWHPVVRDLPPSARSYDWLLPPSEGIPDVRLRVVARDRRLQNSAAGDDRLLVITPGTATPGDFDGDGDVDTDDFNRFAACFTGPNGGPIGATCHAGDFDGDGDIDCNDWTQFVQAWTGVGPPPSLPQCETPIPTVSDWGLVAMALLMLTAGTLVCTNRKLSGRTAWPASSSEV